MEVKLEKLSELIVYVMNLEDERDMLAEKCEALARQNSELICENAELNRELEYYDWIEELADIEEEKKYWGIAQ